jgi:UV DNA damage endonuclease
VCRHSLACGQRSIINPFELITFMRGAAGLPDFDIVLECKQRDLALLRLREDLGRYAPNVAERLREGVARGEAV